jgi:hypothetical protein
MADVRDLTRTRPSDNDDLAAKADQRRSFTGEKLDWMTALSADPRLDARAFEVGFCIAQHVNAETGLAILSDDTISDKTGIPKRWVLRARKSLKDAGWIDWQRTKTANIYWTLGHRINAVTDHQIILREKRAERQTKAKNACLETPPVAHLKHRRTPPVALLETPSVAERETPPVAEPQQHYSEQHRDPHQRVFRDRTERRQLLSRQPFDTSSPLSWHLLGRHDLCRT